MSRRASILTTMLATLVTAFSAEFAMSQIYISDRATIEVVESFSGYDGEVTFRITPENQPCVGYFLNKEDLGFEANLQMLIAAYHAQSPVQIRADQNNDWKGSEAKFCHLSSIRYLKGCEGIDCFR